MSLAFFKKDDVAIAGNTASYPSTADSGNINTRHFCPTYGSRVYGENSARPGVIGIAVGCLDLIKLSSTLWAGLVGQDARGCSQLRADATAAEMMSWYNSSEISLSDQSFRETACAMIPGPGIDSRPQLSSPPPSKGNALPHPLPTPAHLPLCKSLGGCVHSRDFGPPQATRDAPLS